MCGIVAYIGAKDAYPIIEKGLRRLEYRGYDSAGVAIFDEELKVIKRQGKVDNMSAAAIAAGLKGRLGIGHTRWATHGEVNDVNAHPHQSGDERLAIVHNGIIENYDSLKVALEGLGHVFVSETDTEVLIKLIAEVQRRANLTLEEAVRQALSKVIGAYAIVVIDREDPTKLVAARRASPLVLGIGENEFFFASDGTPIVEHTKNVIYLESNEVAVARLDGTYDIVNLENEKQTPFIHKLDLEIEQIEKGGYDYFMLKEIHEQPSTIADAMRGRVSAERNLIRLGGLVEHIDRVANADRIIIVACGTSWHSGLIGEYLIEDLARLPVEVEYASEFRYRNPVITEKDVVIAISQSGETADTLAAVELAKAAGAFCYGIVNVVGSTIARETDAGSYIHAGPEIGVASTKAFTGQVTILSLMAIHLASHRGTIDDARKQVLLDALVAIPTKVEKAIANCAKPTEFIAKELYESQNALYLGRGFNFPVALEGALKLKEISYIHAEGYPAAEMKHGPIALIDEDMPVFVICTNRSAYQKIVSNIEQVKARNGMVIAVVLEGDKDIAQLADFVIEIPDTEEQFSPLLSVIPLQILSYHIAVHRGCNVDQPRNLAKSVTVE
ncbi:MAG: glutamine--fructose-6-phosphate transaminase (isomerizing) [Saprospiraceae bacterium]